MNTATAAAPKTKATKKASSAKKIQEDVEDEDETPASEKKPAKAPKKAKAEKPAELGLTSTEPAAYLVWVGSEHYVDTKEWSDEAVELGISKRLPNVGMARALLSPGVTIFVAHDDGEGHDCIKCTGLRECGACRKRIQEAAELRRAIDKLKDAFKGDWKSEAPRGMHRFEEVREARIEKLEAECKACDECKGKGKIKGGTGGSVKLADGRKWDYRTYNYWLHQPKKFNADDVVSKEMCETCGGTGELPAGRIFGMFVPERVEYILEGDETNEALKSLAGMRLITEAEVKDEPKRKCGKRKVGGYYAVTSADASGAGAREALEKLVQSGAVKSGGAELAGNFVRFHRQFPIAQKRFRGMKRIDMAEVKEAARQAEFVKEALED